MQDLLERVTGVLQNYFEQHFEQLLFSVLFIVAGIIVIIAIDRTISDYFKKTKYDRTIEIFLHRIVLLFSWALLIIIVLGNLGVDVRGFIAGLGVAGIIIGFATKDIFSNLAAGLLLVFTRPFNVGETIEVVGIKGKVKIISMTYSIIITEKGEYVVIPNSRVWGNPIKNISRQADERSTKKAR
jgi:small conductance mechanosensitive channel